MSDCPNCAAMRAALDSYGHDTSCRHWQERCRASRWADASAPTPCDCRLAPLLATDAGKAMLERHQEDMEVCRKALERGAVQLEETRQMLDTAGERAEKAEREFLEFKKAIARGLGFQVEDGPALKTGGGT